MRKKKRSNCNADVVFLGRNINGNVKKKKKDEEDGSENDA